MPESSWNLLLQIPIAGVLVYVVVVFLAHLEKLDTRNKEFLAEQATINREFLIQQRIQMRDSLARLAEEIKIGHLEVSRAVAELHGILIGMGSTQANKGNTGD